MTTDGFTTCLWFDGQAEEAANHYASIFKNSKLGDDQARHRHTREGARGRVHRRPLNAAR